MLRTRPALVLAAACCGTFVGFGSVLIFTFGVFLKPLASAFGWNRSQLSLAFTLTALTIAFCSPFIGRLLDRYPARRIILPCTTIYALVFGSLSFIGGNLHLLWGLFIVLGVVGNGTTQLAYSRVVSAWFAEAQGRALAAVMTGSAAGSMIFPVLAQWLITTYGWRMSYRVLSGVILCLGIPLTALFFHEPPGQQLIAPAPLKDSAKKDGILTDLMSAPFLLLATTLILFSVATNGLEAHLAPLLSDRGLSASEAAAVLSVIGFSTLTNRLLSGYLLDRFQASRVAALSFVICAGGFLSIFAAHSLFSAVVGAALVGVGLGAETDAVPYLLTRFFGLRRFSELYGYTWSAYAVAGAAGPLLMGLAFDRYGSYRSLLALFTALVLLAAVLLLCLPTYGRLQTADQDAPPGIIPASLN